MQRAADSLGMILHTGGARKHLDAGMYMPQYLFKNLQFFILRTENLNLVQYFSFLWGQNYKYSPLLNFIFAYNKHFKIVTSLWNILYKGKEYVVFNHSTYRDKIL